MGVFDFSEVKLSDEEISRIARRDGCSIIRVAISSNGYRHVQHPPPGVSLMRHQSTRVRLLMLGLSWSLLFLVIIFLVVVK